MKRRIVRFIASKLIGVRMVIERDGYKFNNIEYDSVCI